MTAFEMAREVYRWEECARSFGEDLNLHLAHGFVFVTPDVFLMARPVIKNAPKDQILSPWIQFPRADCWHVWLAAGHGALAVLANYEPYPLPWISFERNNRLRFYKRSSFIPKIWHCISKSQA